MVLNNTITIRIISFVYLIIPHIICADYVKCYERQPNEKEFSVHSVQELLNCTYHPEVCYLFIDTLKSGNGNDYEINKAMDKLSNFPNLRGLAICSYDINDEGLQKIGMLNKLEYLRLRPVNNSVGAFLEKLSTCSKLKILAFENGHKLNCQKIDFKHISVTTLWLSSIQPDNATLLFSKISESPSIEFIAIRVSSELNDKHIEPLKNLKSLREFHIGNLGTYSKFRGTGLSIFNNLPNFETLEIEGFCNLSYEGIDTICSMNKLKRLRIIDTRIEITLWDLKKMESLKYLEIKQSSGTVPLRDDNGNFINRDGSKYIFEKNKKHD